MVQAWSGLYSSYCDCVAIVPTPPHENRNSLNVSTDLSERNSPAVQQNGEVAENTASCSEPSEPSSSFSHTPKFTKTFRIITRGAELIDEEDVEKTLAPNKCLLHTITSPPAPKGPLCSFPRFSMKKPWLINPLDTAVFHNWSLETVRTFAHRQYQANHWPVVLAVTDLFLFAPTQNGYVFIWEIETGNVNHMIMMVVLTCCSSLDRWRTTCVTCLFERCLFIRRCLFLSHVVMVCNS